MTNYPEHLQREVDSYLTSNLKFEYVAAVEGLAEAMSYSLLAGGKRVRPVLALATAAALGVEHRLVMPYAAALELIHTYSLIHDDLPAMDDDDLRRGKPTCHVKYGENVAILAGDALYAEALKHLLMQQRFGREHLLETTGLLVSATGLDGMVGGQYLDVCECAQPGADGLRQLHELKTGRLIEASVVGVLKLAGFSGERADNFALFAHELGVLFQIVDDILDVTGSDSALGKPTGSDQRHGKRTYVTEFGLDGSRELAESSYQRANAALARADNLGSSRELKAIAEFIYRRSS